VGFAGCGSNRSADSSTPAPASPGVRATIHCLSTPTTRPLSTRRVTPSPARTI